MERREFVEISGDAADFAGVALILGGLVIVSVRYMLARKSGGETRSHRHTRSPSSDQRSRAAVQLATDAIASITSSVKAK
jgi:hypothetical protein